jgi:hypothetical protein
MENLTIEARVARGAEWLDQQRPGWEQPDNFDLRRFDLSDPCRCVIGQVYGDYDEVTAGHSAIDLDDDLAYWLGFYAGYIDEHNREEYAALETEWVRVIAARRALMNA